MCLDNEHHAANRLLLQWLERQQDLGVPPRSPTAAELQETMTSSGPVVVVKTSQSDMAANVEGATPVSQDPVIVVKEPYQTDNVANTAQENFGGRTVNMWVIGGLAIAACAVAGFFFMRKRK